MEINVQVSTPIERSARVRQLEGIWDVQPSESCKLSWQIEAPLEEQPWSVGLIVGPSGCGKSTVVRHMFGEPASVEWPNTPIIDAFPDGMSINDITRLLGSVGFNTVPAWMRPYHVLSTGEQFRATIARLLAEHEDGPLVVDEFTSVVDRQVAQVGSHAIQKTVRKSSKQFVAVTCHYDVEDWLQPDWVIEPATELFRWRSVQPRPRLNVTVAPLPYSAWRIFAPFHYLTADLNKAARCWGLWVDDKLAAFAGDCHRPMSHGNKSPIWGCARLVTLPDYQGIGLSHALSETVGALRKARGQRYRLYPAHFGHMRSIDRSPKWALIKRPGFSRTSNKKNAQHSTRIGVMGTRPCAIFEYVGPAVDKDQADAVFAYWGK